MLLEPFLCEYKSPFRVYCIDGVFVMVGVFDITDGTATQKAFDGFLFNHKLLKHIASNHSIKLRQNKLPKNHAHTKTKPLSIDEHAIEPIYLLAIDGENHLLSYDGGVIQGFDEASFFEALGLPTASDFLAFLAYRQAVLQDDLIEQKTALGFMYTPAFFRRAWRTEKQLQKYDYMVRVSPAIKSAIYKNQSVIKNLVERQCALAPLWHRMIARWLEKTGDVILAQKLQAQSGYTAMKIVEFVLDYQNFDAEQTAEGKISHEHSYHRLGQHFILIIYGTNQSSELSLQSIHQNHAVILAHYQQELIHKAQEVFLLGFNLSQKDEFGNILVDMQVWSSGV